MTIAVIKGFIAVLLSAYVDMSTAINPFITADKSFSVSYRAVY